MRHSIRTRLTVAFVAAVALTALAVSAAFIGVGYQSSQRQALDNLSVVASLKESQMDAWVRELQDTLAALVLEEDSPAGEEIRTLLAPHAEAAPPTTRTLPRTASIHCRRRSGRT